MNVDERPHKFRRGNHTLAKIFAGGAICTALFLGYNIVSASKGVVGSTIHTYKENSNPNHSAENIPLKRAKQDKFISGKSYRWLVRNQNKYANHHIPYKYRKAIIFDNNYSVEHIPAIRVPVVYKGVAKLMSSEKGRYMIFNTANELLKHHVVPFTRSQLYAKPTFNTAIHNPKLAKKQYHQDEVMSAKQNRLNARTELNTYDSTNGIDNDKNTNN